MRTDRMSGDAERLDAESRALLELSVIRGIPDEDLAGVLGIAVDGVRKRRERVMRELGAESGEQREALEAALRAGAWPEAEPDRATEPAPAPREPDVVAEAPLAVLEPGARSATVQRRRGLIAFAGGAAIAALVAVALALGGEGVDSPPPPQPGATEADAPKTGQLEPLGGGDATGSARIAGPEDRRLLRLSVRGLPPVTDGGYVVWLYDSVSDARAVTGSRRVAFSVREPLPPGFARYRFLDLSREPADGNRNHSGESVLRVPLERIPGA